MVSCTMRNSLFLRYRLHRYQLPCRCSSSVAGIGNDDPDVVINGKVFKKDSFTNLTPRIVEFLDRKLLHKQYHPLNLVKQHIADFFHKKFIGRTGNPIFSVYDNLNPIVTVKENFDSLLVPEDHVSRKLSDTYYINQNFLLRSHTTAHQAELIGMGLDNFLIFGDCYRRDEIDSKHYPVFHQLDGVYTLNKDQIQSATNSDITLFEKGEDSETKQGIHTTEASKFFEDHLKSTLIDLNHHLNGKDIEFRWVSAYFPFTHPSWELELLVNDQWIETLGCGIIRQKILENAGAADRIGWAFGIGLERLAMRRYEIPDIRVFWSEDSGITSQFEGLTPEMKISYQPVSSQPQCINDISFFLSEEKPFHHNDFYDIVRNVGADYIEQVKVVDEFFHPKQNRLSRTYRIIYRHMDRPLTKIEVNLLHLRIANAVADTYDVEIRQ